MPSDDPPPTVDTTPLGGPPLRPEPESKTSVGLFEGADTRSESAADMPVPFDRVQAACQTFTAEWEAGGQTDLPTYLVKVAQDDQATLLRNLLEYEIHKRREHGESPRARTTSTKFPATRRSFVSCFWKPAVLASRATNSQLQKNCLERSCRRQDWGNFDWFGNSEGAVWGQCLRRFIYNEGIVWP